MIEVGEYVRTEKGKIGKVIRMRKYDNSRYDRPHYLIEWNNGKIYFMSQVKNFKHSKNIIDLIEVGDFVNGYKVDSIENRKLVIGNTTQVVEQILENNEDIKTIVTKEQFNSVMYKVVE